MITCLISNGSIGAVRKSSGMEVLIFILGYLFLTVEMASNRSSSAGSRVFLRVLAPVPVILVTDNRFSTI